MALLLVRMLRTVHCRGGEGVVIGFLWFIGLYEGVEDRIREYGLRVV